MTNLEAVLSIFNYSQGAEFALTNQGLVSTDTYVIANEKSVNLAAANMMLSAAANPDLKEADASITWDNDTLVSVANSIFVKWDEPQNVVGNTIVEFKQELW